jgi:hypothetical protein
MAKSKSKGHVHSKQVHEAVLARLEREVVTGPLPPAGVVIEPKGQAKMSDVLEQFVEPYLKFARTADEHRKLFNLAALAWNAALLLPRDHENMIAEAIGAGFAGHARQAQADAKNILDLLIARKRSHFADNTRRIIKVEVTETPDGFHLTVASTL